MADYLIQDTTLDAIADAINAKTGGSSAMTPAEMVTAIGSIPSGGGSGIQTATGTFTVVSNTRNSPSMVHNLNTQMLFGVIYAVPTNGELSVGSHYAVLQCYFIASPQFFNDAGLTDTSVIYNFPYVTNESAQSKSFAPGDSVRIVCLRSPYSNGGNSGSFGDAAATFRENTGNSVSIEASSASTGGAQFATGLTYKWKIWGVVE